MICIRYVRFIYAFSFLLKEMCLLVTCPINWNMFAALATFFMSHVFLDVDADTFNSFLFSCVFYMSFYY